MNIIPMLNQRGPSCLSDFWNKIHLGRMFSCLSNKSDFAVISKMLTAHNIFNTMKPNLKLIYVSPS